MDSGRVRFVYKHLIVLGDESLRAAEASECAAEQGRFWGYHETLFENWAGENKGAFSDRNLSIFADDIGLDTEQFSECLSSRKYLDRISDDIDAARSAGVQSTPTLFVNDQLIGGLQEYEVYRNAIEQELAK